MRVGSIVRVEIQLLNARNERIRTTYPWKFCNFEKIFPRKKVRAPRTSSIFKKITKSPDFRTWNPWFWLGSCYNIKENDSFFQSCVRKLKILNLAIKTNLTHWFFVDFLFFHDFVPPPPILYAARKCSITSGRREHNLISDTPMTWALRATISVYSRIAIIYMFNYYWASTKKCDHFFWHKQQANRQTSNIFLRPLHKKPLHNIITEL